jgi:hypothetical protein
MVVDRVSNAEKQAKTLTEIESKFVSGVERQNLKALSLEELAHQFEEIGQQAQLLQGRILLEAKSRFNTTNDFGAWIQEQGGTLCAITKQHRTRLMNLAEFFDGDKRKLDKISITAAYEISAPINADIAEKIYEIARGKNLSVAEVKKQITQIKNSASEFVDTTIENANPVTNKTKKAMPLPVSITDIKSRIIAEIGDISAMKALQILEDVMNEFRLKLQNEI